MESEYSQYDVFYLKEVERNGKKHSIIVHGIENVKIV